MRALVLLAVMASLTLYGLIIPQIGIYAYIWYGLFRPDFVAFAAGKHNYGEWLAIALILGSIRFLPNAGRAWITNPITLTFLLLEIPIGISSFTALMPGYAQYPYGLFLRMSIVLLFIPLVITTFEDFTRLYFVTAVSLGTWGLWHGATGVLHGGLRINGGIGGFMSENNTFACGLTMVIPFCWYSRQLVKSKPLKVLLQAMTWGSVATVILTFSRGAAIALLMVLLIIVMQSKRRLIALIAIVTIGIGPATYLVREKYFDRLSTIGAYEEDNSAMSRIATMKAAVQLWRAHPYFGVGMGTENFVEAARPILANSRLGVGFVVHNSYLQMLAQCGIFAFVLYIVLLFSVLWRTWRSSRRLAKSHPEYLPYPRAIQVSIIAYLICSFTQPRFTFDLIYIIVMYAAVWYNLEKSLPPERVPAPQSRMPAFILQPATLQR
jgi:putative inorganic carbon (hco3(-)) transporter